MLTDQILKEFPQWLDVYNTRLSPFVFIAQRSL